MNKSQPKGSAVMNMKERGRQILDLVLADDAEVDFRIRTGTEMYRKGFKEFKLIRPDGKPVERATVRFTQKSHEFLFGCNAFMFNQFPAKEQNDAYRERLAEIFNQLVIPFYWSDLEPESGELRFESGSRPVYRRPPPDEVLEFCEERGIAPKGHPLCWHQFVPEWAPKTRRELMRRLDRRLGEIAGRYGDRIFLWDAVNEAQTRNPLLLNNAPPMPDDHVEQAFRLIDRHLPLAQLIYNDDNRWWNFQGDYSPVYLLVKRLQDRGCRVGGLGLQYHMFEFLLQEAGQFMNPRHLLRVLDLYGKLNVPVNFSEVSIISRRDLGDGDRFQELVTEKLYRLWFSHPATEGITWWNLVDGTAAYALPGSEEGENSLRAGLINYDFSEKPAFKALKRLITREWHSSGTIEYREGARNLFHGFYGNYDLEIQTDSGIYRTSCSLSKDAEPFHVTSYTVGASR